MLKNSGEIETKINLDDIKNYLKNIRLDEKYHIQHPEEYPNIQQYIAEFGRKGILFFRLYTDDDKAIYPNNVESLNKSIYISSIHRGLEDSFIRSVEGKKDSRGEGAMVIASLFLLFPNVYSVHYEDESWFEDDSESFWKKIGGSETELMREDFFNYFYKKFGYNPDEKNGKFANGGIAPMQNFNYTIGGL